MSLRDRIQSRKVSQDIVEGAEKELGEKRDFWQRAFHDSFNPDSESFIYRNLDSRSELRRTADHVFEPLIRGKIADYYPAYFSDTQKEMKANYFGGKRGFDIADLVDVPLSALKTLYRAKDAVKYTPLWNLAFNVGEAISGLTDKGIYKNKEEIMEALPGYDPDDTLYADKTAPGGNYGTHVHYNENYREGSRYSYALGGGKRKRYDDPDYPEGYVVQDPRYTRANYPSEMHLDEVDYLDGVQASTLAEEISHGQRAMEGGLFAQGAEFEGTGLTNYIATLSEETRAKTDAFFDVAREEGWDVALAQFPNIATTWLSYVKSDQLIAPTESHFVRSSRSFVGTPWISDIESTELLDNFERFKDKPAYDPASVRVSSSPRFQNNTFIENASYALFGQNNRYNKYYDSGDIRSTEDRFGLITNKDLKGTDEYIDADRRYDVLKNIFMADFENYEHGVPESSKNMHFIRDEFKYDSSLSIKEFFPTREEFRRYVEEFEENDINLYSITRSPDVEYGDDTWLMAEKIQQLDSYMTQHIAKTHNVQEAGPLQTIQNYLLRTSTPSYQSYTDVVDRYDHDYEYNPGEGGPIKSQIYRSGNKILDNLRKLKFWDKEGE